MAKVPFIFAQFDVNYADHPKIAALSDAAFRAHVEMVLYSRKYLTDGIIRNRIANRFGSDSLTELATNDEVNPSVNRLSNGDYQLYGFLDIQDSRESAETRSQVNTRNGQLGGRPPGTHSVTKPLTETKPESESESESESYTTSEKSDDPNIGILCNYLADQMERNGSKRPTIGKGWRTAARLMLAKDERTPEQVTNIIDWCQSDPFWKANILSMPKLREKFDTLRLQSERTNGSYSGRLSSIDGKVPAWQIDERWA